MDLGYAGKAAEKLKVPLRAIDYCDVKEVELTGDQNDNRDDEFLASRILFLMTYNTTLDFNPLFDDYQLGDSINAVRNS